MISQEEYLAAAFTNVDTSDFEMRVSEWLTSVIPHDNIVFLAYYQDRRPTLLMSNSSNPKVHADLDKAYIAGVYLLDPFHELHINKVARGVYRLRDVAPDRFHLNQYYIEYYRNTTLVDEIAFVSYPSDGVSIQVCLGRDSNSNKKFSAKTLNDARQIAPIVSAMVEKHWRNLDTTGEYTEIETTNSLIASVKEIYEIQLSPRQAEVAMLVLRGHSSESIGLRLNIKTSTVKVFRKQLYKKCEISSQAELFKKFMPLLIKA